jgi:exopolysaccharide/PEP-CTERM locus tyrosine autokinase
MSSLIEQANRRLEQLRRAGVDLGTPSRFADSAFHGTGFQHSGFQHSGFPETAPPPEHRVASGARGRAADADFQDTVPDGLAEVRRGAAPSAALEGRAMPRTAAQASVQPARPAVAPTPGRREPARTPSLAGAPAGKAPVEGTQVAAQRLHIDLARLAGMGYLVPAQAQSLLSDLLRVIKRPLLQNMRRPAASGGPEHRGNIVVVTSAVPGEGKTFVSTNLAMSIAMEVDHAAILIDGDVLRPSVFNRYNLEPQRGLMDLLVNPRLAVQDVLASTNVSKLCLMSAGTAQDRAEEMLASAAMDTLLDNLSARYPDRAIIIDSPPLLVTTESRALAERAGQVVLVVEADRTPRDQISRAFDTLANCPIVLSVLNKSRAIESDYVYGY